MQYGVYVHYRLATLTHVHYGHATRGVHALRAYNTGCTCITGMQHGGAYALRHTTLVRVHYWLATLQHVHYRHETWVSVHYRQLECNTAPVHYKKLACKYDESTKTCAASVCTTCLHAQNIPCCCPSVHHACIHLELKRGSMERVKMIKH